MYAPRPACPRDAAPAEFAAQSVVARERGVELGRGRYGIRKAERIERGLRHPHADVRPGDEGGIAEQRHAPGREPRRLDVEDRLEEGLRALDEPGELARQQRLRLGFEFRDHVVADERRRHRGEAVALPGSIRAEILQDG